MSDNSKKNQEETIEVGQQMDDKQPHEDPATPIKPATDEDKPKPASESAKNSK